MSGPKEAGAQWETYSQRPEELERPGSGGERQPAQPTGPAATIPTKANILR